MPLDAISATLLTTAALMFIVLIRRVRLGLWPRARWALRHRWPAAGLPWNSHSAALLPPAMRPAWDVARRAAPQAQLMARVSLSRIATLPAASAWSSKRMPMRGLSVDVLVWDKTSRKRMVVLVQTSDPSPRRRKRFEQTLDALRFSGIPVCVWQQSAWPTVAAAREQFRAAGLTRHPASSVRRRAAPRGFEAQTQPSSTLL